MRESYDLDISGVSRSFPCQLDQKLAGELYSTATELNYGVAIGKTLCANDFYEGKTQRLKIITEKQFTVKFCKKGWIIIKLFYLKITRNNKNYRNIILL